ncbi:MAG: sigma-70 family RNA polymerase sigma factor [Planctomycetes bacterium]|nr:sigma-70 family RNA polymerase sigma factor [Planctomycetota bacterium]
MNSRASPTPNEELLLAHSEFLAGLASQLVHDASDAQDIVQETMLSALRRPPTDASSVRGWLSTVARNHALQLFRARQRRATREEQSARAEGVPSTGDIVERENARRAVVDALVELHEPYRAVILLRFYEDLPPREVARRLGIPVETARTRIKRGLAMLRGELDRRYAKDRGRWMAALLPLTYPRGAVPTALSGSAPQGQGLAWIAATSLALLAGLAYFTWPLWGARVRGDALPISAAHDPNAGPLKLLSQTADESEERADRAELELRCTLRVEVTRAGSGARVGGAAVSVSADGVELASGVTDANGGVEFDVPQRSLWVVDVGATQASLAARAQVADDRARTEFAVELELADACRVAGRTIDEVGRPMPFVELLALDSLRPEIVDGECSGVIALARSDASGHFELGGLPSRFYLHARAPGLVAVAGFVAQFDAARDVLDLEFVLQPEWTLRGRVVDADGAGVADASVDALTIDRRGQGRSTGERGSSWRSLICPATTTRADGSFELRGVPPRSHNLRASKPGVGATSVGAFEARDDFELVLERGVDLELALVDETGDPVADALVACAGAELQSSSGKSGADGIVRLRVFDERTRLGLRIRAPGFAARLDDLVLDGRSYVRRVIALSPAAPLVGEVREADGSPAAAARVVLRGQLENAPPESGFSRTLGSLLELDEAFTDAQGRFTLYMSGAGERELLVFPGGELAPRARRRLASGVQDVSIELDPRARDAVTFRGRVVDALSGQPLSRFTATARLAREREKLRTAALQQAVDGRFDLGVEVTGSWGLTVSAEGYAPTFVRPEFYAVGVHELEVAMLPARSLSVRVVDALGNPVTQARVICEDPQGRPLAASISPFYWTNVLPLGARGELELIGLPAQDVVLRVRLPEVDLEQRFVFDLREPYEDEQVLSLDLDVGSPKREVELVLVQRLATRGADFGIVGRWKVEVRDERGVLCASFAGYSGLEPGQTRLERSLRCWVQRYDEHGTLTAQSLQMLDGDTLSRELGPQLVPGAETRVRVALPAGPCRISAQCEGFEAATADVAPDSPDTADIVVLRFEPKLR